jgi:putative heme-binding domain-containing protein
MARLGEPSETRRQKWTERLDRLYPSATYELNAELVQLLVFLKSPSVIGKSLSLMGSLGPEPLPDWGYLVQRNARYGGTVGKMLQNMPPVRAIHFAFVLRNVKHGWTLDQRRKYFEFFPTAASGSGGNSFAKFLVQFRDDAIATCSQAEQIQLASVINQSLLAAPIESTPPQGPGRNWTTAEALPLAQNLRRRNFRQGRNLYHATACSKCHRLAGEGGSIGPDLSTAAKKFSMSDLLDAIIEPSKAISDQYASQQVVTADDQVLVGRVVEIGDEYHVYTVDAQAKPTVLKKQEVDRLEPSKVSQMPTGLLNALNEEELKDLLAYLVAEGDARSRIYR